MNFSPIYSVLCSSLHLSLSLSVFVCVCEYFSFVFAPLIKVLFLSNMQAFEKKNTHTHTHIYVLQGRWWRQNLCQNTHQTPWESKPLYTPSKIIQKTFSPLIFFTLHFTEFWRWTNTLGHIEPGCFCMLSIWKMFVETEVICKLYL